MRDKAITINREENFSGWFNQVVRQAKWIHDTPTPGCYVVMPEAESIWERIQFRLDQMIKGMGVSNAYFPLLIPKNLLQREKDHVEGFSPECAVVTHGGGDRLTEELFIRPTSETIMYPTYSELIQSYRDLPLLFNQWANIIRWEKRPRPFIRSLEFRWQEGHCCHETQSESLEFLLKILSDVYTKFVEEWLAIPIIAGAKPESQKFPGALNTYTIESMMGDGKALQMGTSHDLGQNFSKPFNISFQGRDQQKHYVWQNSWGMTTRLLGALVMVHGDQKGICLPPKIAPVQVAIIPIGKGEKGEAALKRSLDLADQLEKAGIRSVVDQRQEYSPPWKFNDWELRGVPLRIDFGPKEMEATYIQAKRRDAMSDGKNIIVHLPFLGLAERIIEILGDIQVDMFKSAKNWQAQHISNASNYPDFVKGLRHHKGFISAHICGQKGCSHPDDIKLEAEAKSGSTIDTTLTDEPTSDDWIQNHTSGATGRVITDPKATGNCIRCGKLNSPYILYAKAY